MRAKTCETAVSAALVFGMMGLLTAAVAIAAPAKRSSTRPGLGQRSRTFVFTAVVHVPAIPAAGRASARTASPGQPEGSRGLSLWIPLPYQDAYQTISSLRIASPVAYRIHRGPESDRYLFAVVPTAEARRGFDISVKFQAVRREHRAARSPAAGADPASDAELARYLQPDRLIPINGVIADLSRRETIGAGTPIEKARRLYDYVIANMHYDHNGAGWGRGDAVWACTSRHGNCTDFHSLFIALARAAGIPARFEIGFPLPADAHRGEIASYHCWAQFYVGGIGWIPVDASEAWKHPDRRAYFFGATDANRIMFSRGRDLRLQPAPAAGSLNYFVYPYAELDGKPFELSEKYFFRDERQGAASGEFPTPGPCSRQPRPARAANVRLFPAQL